MPENSPATTNTASSSKTVDIKPTELKDWTSPEIVDSLFPTAKDGVDYSDTTGDKTNGSAKPTSSGENKGQASEGQPSGETNPTGESPDGAVDLSGIPGVLQAAINALPAEKRPAAAKEIREGYLRHKDWTQSRQEVSKDKKDADAWREAMKRPDLVRAWQKAMSQDGEPKKAEPEEPAEDYEAELDKLIAEGTGKEWRTFLQKREKAIREEAKNLTRTEVERFYQEKVERPRQVFKSVEDALQAHCDENGITYDDMRAAVVRATKYPANGPIESWDPAKAVDLVTPFLVNGAAKPVANKSNGAAPHTPAIPKVAPPGRGSGAAAPSPLPAHRREGRPARNNSEYAEELAYLLTEQLGKPISVADLDAAM